MVAQSRLSRVDLPDERLWVKWYLTKRCDLGCAFCHNAMSRKHWPKETAEGLVDIAQAMVDSGEVKGVTLLGGEPTLADGLFEVCRIFDRADLPFGLITAGHHVASPRFEEIFGNSQLSFVGISLDGFDAGVVEAIRGRDIFAAQQNGLRALLDFRERGSSNYKVHVNLIVHRLSRDSVLDSLDRLAAFGVDRVQLLAYNNTDLGERNAPDLRLTFTEELELVEQLVEHMRVRVGSQWPPAFQIEPSFVPAIGRQYMREILHADVAAEGHVCPIAQKTIFVSGSGVTGSWVAEWQNDASGDPEYYFIASLIILSFIGITRDLTLS